MVGITGMDGKLVRPRWQPEPPNIPDAGVAWMAFGIASRESDVYPYTAFISDELGTQLQRHENLHVLCSFYDLGATGNSEADALSSLLRDGTAIPQNLELLQQNGFAFVACNEMVTVPSLLKQRWLYRVDLSLHLRRIVVRNYPVLSVESADIELDVNNAATDIISETIHVSQ